MPNFNHLPEKIQAQVAQMLAESGRLGCIGTLILLATMGSCGYGLFVQKFSWWLLVAFGVSMIFLIWSFKIDSDVAEILMHEE